MTPVADVDVVNPAKGFLAGQYLWRENRRPESGEGLVPFRDHPASGSGWSTRAYFRRSATGIRTRLPILLAGKR